MEDFDRICAAGFAEPVHELPRLDRTAELQSMPGMAEEVQAFDYGEMTPRETIWSERTVRDRAFRRLVVAAYDRRCAVTGLRLINGGGRAEVEAAHIRPVASGGPDMVNNGLALSGTAHWMFDRGLIGIAEDNKSILVSRQVNDEMSVREMINSSGQLTTPANPRAQPYERFTQWHREHCFKH